MSTVTNVSGNSTSAGSSADLPPGGPPGKPWSPNGDGSLLVWNPVSGVWEVRDTLRVLEPESVSLEHGDYLIDGVQHGAWNGRLPSDFYIIGDSIVSPNGGIDGVISYDTDSTGIITNLRITNPGSNFTRDFQLSFRSSILTSAMAWADVTVVDGALDTVTLTRQSALFATDLTAVPINNTNGQGVSSWAYLLWNEWSLGEGSHIDAMPGTSIARTGTTYQYNAPPATPGQVMIVALGGNDAGGIEIPVGSGLTAGGNAMDITQEEFYSGFYALLSAGLNDGYRVIVMLAAYNRINEFADDDTWIEASDAVRRIQRQVCADLGITEIWSYPTTNMADYLHPTQIGHNILRREIYPRMTPIISASAGRDTRMFFDPNQPADAITQTGDIWIASGY